MSGLPYKTIPLKNTWIPEPELKPRESEFTKGVTWTCVYLTSAPVIVIRGVLEIALLKWFFLREINTLESLGKLPECMLPIRDEPLREVANGGWHLDKHP